MADLTVATNQKRQVIDITGQVENKLSGSGLVNILVKHTTAGLKFANRT